MTIAALILATLPNIVVVIFDDWPSTEFGMFGGRQIVAPNVEALIAAGTVFPDCHAPDAVCRPSLASLLSGRTPAHNGVRNNVTNGGALLGTDDAIGQVMRDAGYSTFLAGKFWEYSGGGGNGIAESRAMLYGFDGVEGVRRPSDLVREDQADTLAWVATVEEPFFLIWSPKLPHEPTGFGTDYSAVDPNKVPIPDTATDVAAVRAATVDFFANMAWLDAALVELLAACPPNTIVITFSDNGHYYGRLGKGAPFEAGLRSAISITGPGIPAVVRPEYLPGVDISATVAGFGGAVIPASWDGRDWSAEIASGEPIADTGYGGANWSASGYPGEAGQSLVAVYYRDRRYKYLRFVRAANQELRDIGVLAWVDRYVSVPTFPAGSEWLYDLDVDPFETTNIADADPERLAEYRAACRSWWLRHNPTICPADRTYDGVVDLADVAATLSAYGVDAGGDVDGDGDTDLGDLSAVLGAFGDTCGWEID